MTVPRTDVDSAISEAPHRGMVDEATGWLVAECRAWCERNLTAFAEKLTGDPEQPLKVYFASRGDRDHFRARFCEAG